MKLSSLLKEVQSKPIPKNSYESFYWSYYYIVRSRRMIERSIVQGKMELNRTIKDLNHRIENRVKDKNGDLTSPLEVHEKKTNHFVWNKRQVEFLKQVQNLESTWLNLLSSRGLDMFDEEDIEEKTFFKMRDEPVEKEEE